MSVGWSKMSRVLLGFLFPPPEFLKHACMHCLFAYCCLELDVCVCCLGLLGAATLPRLLMPYLLLIRMSHLSLAICTSWLANPLPNVWCWGGAQQHAHDSIPAPDIKRPFCFVVFFFFCACVKKRQWKVLMFSSKLTTHLGGFGWHQAKGTSPSVCTVSAALDVLDLSWQMLKQKVEEVM